MNKLLNHKVRVYGMHLVVINSEQRPLKQFAGFFKCGVKRTIGLSGMVERESIWNYEISQSCVVCPCSWSTYL